MQRHSEANAAMSLGAHTQPFFNYNWIVETMKMKCRTAPKPQVFKQQMIHLIYVISVL